MEIVALAGRILVGVVFIVIGTRLLIARRMVAGLLASKKVPRPGFVALCGGIIELALGALAVIGLWMPAIGVAMALFVIVATIIVHDFWNAQGARRMLEINTILTHALLVGGLLVMAGYPW